jgi:hypothetical protein
MFLDPGIFLDHCGQFELYFTIENTAVPSPPWPAGSPSGTQIEGEAVSPSPGGPFYQFTQPVISVNSGDPAAIELGGQFIITSAFNAPNGTGGGFALLGPQGTCP